MPIRIYILAAICDAALVFSAGCASQAARDDASQQALQEEIVQANRDLERRFRSGDMAGVAAVYTDDAVVAGSSGYRIEGRDDIEAYWAGIDEPIDWRLDVFDVERTGDRCARQSGRSTLRYRQAGAEERVSVVLFELIWRLSDDGEWRIARDVYWRPDVEYTEAIARVLAVDADASRVRNLASESAPISAAIDAYIATLHEIDHTGTPGDFSHAMRRHEAAWADLSRALASHTTERGEMHAILDEVTSEGSGDSAAIQHALDEVWSTWREVERSAERHGVSDDGED